MLRSILYADDPSYRLAGFRKLDPITSLDAELRFIGAAEAAFFKGAQSAGRAGSCDDIQANEACGSHTGWQLGSEPEVQVATVVSNHLTTGLMKYFGDSARYGPLINLFEKLVVKEGEVACLLAQSYLGMSESFPSPGVRNRPCNRLTLSARREQTKRSRLSAYCSPRSSSTRSRTRCCTFSATSSGPRARATGRLSWRRRRSTVLRASLSRGPN